MATFDINDVARRVQYTSTGQTGPFGFTFQVNASSELLVYIDDTEKTETTHYTVSLNVDGTGSVTFTTATTSGELITIIGDQPLSRTTVFQVGQVNQPTTLETEFDNTLIRQQQIKEITDRSIQLKPSTGRTVTGSGTSGPLYFPYDTTVANNANRVLKYDSNGTSLELGSTSTNIDALAAIASDITTVSGISSNVTTVAGIASNVTSVASNASNINTVATNIANVNTVAGISSNVTTVAGLSTEITALSGVSSQDLIDVAALGTELQTLAPIASDITTVAGVSGNVTTVAGISSDVSTVSGISANTTTVAGISGNVTTVAGISSDVSTVAGISANVTTVAGDTTNIGTVAGNTTNINTVATNITDVNTFANRYRISATDPTTSLDIGDLYYDTTNDIMKVYGSSGWQNAGSSVNGTSARFQYSVSSSTTTITGTDDNGNTLLYDAGYVDVYLNGIKMVNGSDVTVTSGSSVVFATAIGTSGTDTVDIIAYGTFNVAAIDATSITSGTLGYARGGTGLGALGSADEVLQMNAGGTALEYGKVDTANIADDAVGATQLDVSGNGTSGQFLASDADGSFSWVDAPASGGFSLGTALTGTTPTIDWSSATAFSQTLTGDTTYSFSNVPSGGEIELYLKNVGKQYNLESPTSLSSVTFSEFSSSTHHTIFFNNDGSKMYVGVATGTYPIYQYSLSTNYDISTKTYDSVVATGGTITAWAYGGKSFNDDGTKMIVSFNSDLYEYSLTTPYDISTLSTTANHTVSFTSLFRDPVGGTSTPSSRSMKFFADGYGLFIGNQTHKGQSGHNIPMAITINLSTAYDISSTLTLDSFRQDFDGAGLMTFDAVAFYTGNINTSISDDGYVFTILTTDPKTSSNLFSLIKCYLTTPFDLGTAQIASNIQLDVSSATAIYTGEIQPDGKTFRYVDSTGRGTAKRLDTSGDYSITFPSATSEVPATVGVGADPATTSYLRMVSLDGTNVLITDHKEIN